METESWKRRRSIGYMGKHQYYRRFKLFIDIATCTKAQKHFNKYVCNIRVAFKWMHNVFIFIVVYIKIKKRLKKGNKNVVSI